MKKKYLFLSLMLLNQHAYSQDILNKNQSSLVPTAYDGNCLCRNDRASDGSYCGNRSAYTRANGAYPSCDSNGNRINQNIVETTTAEGKMSTTSLNSCSYDRVATPSYCPPNSSYRVPQGYRLAGISPSCNAVIIPMYSE